MITENPIQFPEPELNKDWGKYIRIGQESINAHKDPFHLDDDYLSLWTNWNGIDIRPEALQRGLKPLRSTYTFAQIWGMSRNLARPSIVVFGSAAYKTIETQIDYLGWYGEMVGLNRGGSEEVTDYDIWVPSEVQHKLRARGVELNECRSNNKLLIADITERIEDGKDVKIQVHMLKDLDLNPVIAQTYSAPTALMATCLVINGPDFLILDPFESVSKGPWNQDFPRYLFDKKNLVAGDTPRAINNAMIWALTTPMPGNSLNNLRDIREQIKIGLQNMGKKELNSLASKFLKFQKRIPYAVDLYEESTSLETVKLAKLGFLPKMLSINGIRDHLLVNIGYFVAMQHELGSEISSILPELTFDDVDYLNLDKISKAVEMIDWEQIQKVTLPIL